MLTGKCTSGHRCPPCADLLDLPRCVARFRRHLGISGPQLTGRHRGRQGHERDFTGTCAASCRCVLCLSHAFRLQAAATALRGVTKRFDNEEPSVSTPNASAERTKAKTTPDA